MTDLPDTLPDTDAPPPRRVVLYARVSTPERAVRRLKHEERARQDPETQLQPMRRYAAAQGWTVFAEYVDRIPGAIEHRPGFDAALADLEAHKADVLVVWKLDRAARSMLHFVELLARLDRAGVSYVSTTEALDTSTPVGRFTVHILAALAEMEHALIAERVKAGMARAKAGGARFGRPLREIDLDAARRLLASGMGLRQVARALGCPRSTLHDRLHLEHVEAVRP
jgi:DNA invertase Pin-like site-specific DNA recombinase